MFCKNDERLSLFCKCNIFVILKALIHSHNTFSLVQFFLVFVCFHAMLGVNFQLQLSLTTSFVAWNEKVVFWRFIWRKDLSDSLVVHLYKRLRVLLLLFPKRCHLLSRRSPQSIAKATVAHRSRGYWRLARPVV